MSQRSKKQAKEKITSQASEELYQVLFEQAADGIFIADERGYVEVNRRGCEMLGYTREEILNLSLQDLLPVEDLARDPPELDEMRAGKTPLKERRLRCKDGRLLPVEINAHRLADGRFLSLIRDISQHKQVEEALRKSEERLQLALDAAQMGQWDWNIVTGEVTWSEKCLAIYGLPPDTEMSYERFLRALHPEDREYIDSALRRAVEERGSYDEPKRAIWPDGSIHWTASRGQVYCDDTGQPIRMIGVSFDITKWKETEAALQKSHEELRMFFSQTIDGCFFTMLDEPVRWDEKTDKEEILDYVFAHQRITQVNDAMLAQYGATHEQMLKHTPNDFFQHNLAHGRDLWRRLFDAGKIRLESDERKLDGTPMWLEGEYIVLYDSKGCIAGHFGIQRDVTQRKAHLWFLESMDQVNRAIQGAADLEQLMREALDTLLEVFGCDRAWLVYPCDPEATTWQTPMERTRPEYPGVLPIGIELPLDPIGAEVFRILRNADGPVKFGPIYEFQAPMEIVQGFGVQSFIAMAVYPKIGRPWSFGLHQCSYPRVWTPEEERLFQEIGRRLADSLTSLLSYRNLRESEAELRASEERYRAQAQQVQNIIDTVPEGVILLSEDQVVTLTNPVAKQYLTLLAPELQSGRITHLGQRPLNELLTSPPIGLWHEITSEDWSFEAIARPVENSSHNSGWVLVLRDVTQERDIQRQVQRQERLAAVGQLAAGIAHDFNNILAVINLYAQLISRTVEMPARAQEELHTIQQQIKQATDLIQQVLDFSRQSVLKRRPFDLLPFMEKFVTLLKRTLPEHVQIELSHDAETYFIQADPSRMQQVMMNLAVNARDAMPEGGRLQIRLARVQTEQSRPMPVQDLPPGKWVQIEVADSGDGIPPEALSHIFEPFFTTKAEGQGTGLGLAQVYGIVQQHEGYIDLATEIGQGTTFFLYFPALNAGENTADVFDKSSLQLGQGQRILIVEDDPTIRKALQSSLAVLNYEVMIATNGREALTILTTKADEVDLVLSDAVMPEIGGIALFHAIREQYPTIPVALLTGHPLSKEMEFLQTLGLAGWLPKPPDLTSLSNLLAKALTV